MSRAALAIARTRRLVRRALVRPTHPIAIHLGWFAAGILIPVLGVVAFMLIDTARLWREDALSDARVIADHLNTTVDVELEKAIVVGRTLATAWQLDDTGHARFMAQARGVSRDLGVNITVRDRDGQQIVNTAVADGTPLPVSNESVRAVDRLAAERKMPVVSDLLIGTIRKQPTVLIDIPVIRASEVVNLISVSMPPDRFSPILSTGLPDRWIAGMIGRDGRLIARSMAQDRYLGTTNRPFVEAATGAQGSWSGITRDGIAIGGYYVRSPLSGWIVSVAVPQSVLRLPVKQAMLWLGGLVVLSLAVSGYLGWRLSRRISAPIRDLVSRARELGEGRMPSVTRASVSEVNEVIRALRAASVELERRAAAARAAAETMRANEERLQLLQDTADIGTIDWDIAADRAICSPRLYEMLALPSDRQPVLSDILARVHPADRPRAEQVRRQLAEGGGRFADEIRIALPNGEDRWIHFRGSLALRDGKPFRLLAAGIDITDRKQSEQHLHFLLREISHRSKNLLAVIQGMASQTAKSAETVADFRRRLGDRLMGLAASHDLLVNQNWVGASVESLVRGQLAPFIDKGDTRPRIHGPEVNLQARAAEALGLALHELATNSLKYGALNDPSGWVEIVWDVYDTGNPDGPDARAFRIEWIEHAAAPVSPPVHRGFGRMVIERMVETTFSGHVILDFPPEGLHWRLDAPATCFAPSNPAMAA